MTLPPTGAPPLGLPPPGPFEVLRLDNLPIPFKLTWAREAVWPGRIGVRKDVSLLKLFKLTAKADVSVADWRAGAPRLIYGFSCKDRLLHGRVSVNVPARVVEYRKKLALPNGAVVAIGAGLQHVGAPPGSDPLATSLSKQFRPLLGVQLLLGGAGGNAVFAGDGFSYKGRLPLPTSWAFSYPRLELEAFSSVRIPQLTTRYSVQRNGGFSIGMGAGDPLGRDEPAGDPHLHVHVQQLNFVVRL